MNIYHNIKGPFHQLVMYPNLIIAILYNWAVPPLSHHYKSAISYDTSIAHYNYLEFFPSNIFFVVCSLFVVIICVVCYYKYIHI